MFCTVRKLSRKKRLNHSSTITVEVFQGKTEFQFFPRLRLSFPKQLIESQANDTIKLISRADIWTYHELYAQTRILSPMTGSI